MDTGLVAIIGAVCTGVGALLVKVFDFKLSTRKQGIDEQAAAFVRLQEIVTFLERKLENTDNEVKSLRKEGETCREENLKMAFKVGELTAENSRLRTELDELKKKVQNDPGNR